jgi:diguanylate cyclase (GGDEF)-like protein/PAS domain S-box-containing protein
MTEADSFYDTAPCGLVSTTPDGRIQRVNDTMLEWTGYSRDQLLGMAFVSLLDAGSRLFYETRQLPILRLNGAVHEVSLVLVRADGERLAALVNSVTVVDEHGETQRIDTAVFDSTRRQDYERQLLAARREAERSEARTRVLQQASVSFVGCDTEDELAQALADNVRQAFSSPVVAVHLAGGDGLGLAGGREPFDVHALVDPDTIGESLVVLPASRPTSPAADGDALTTALEAARLQQVTITPLVEGSLVVGTVTCFYGRWRDVDDATTELHYALARQAVQVLRRIRLQRRLEAIALHDPLTGLANRALLRTRLSDALTSAALRRSPVALIFVDLDGFKQINDLFDHSVGDSVLRETASRLTASVRADDVVGRFGGDEFLVVCDDADETAATAIAERVRTAVKLPLLGIADERSVSASIGVAVYRPDDAAALSAAEVFRFADAAMYASKDAGKDRVSVTTI